jgi:hypothetical protein
MSTLLTHNNASNGNSLDIETLKVKIEGEYRRLLKEKWGYGGDVIEYIYTNGVNVEGHLINKNESPRGEEGWEKVEDYFANEVGPVHLDQIIDAEEIRQEVHTMWFEETHEAVEAILGEEVAGQFYDKLSQLVADGYGDGRGGIQLPAKAAAQAVDGLKVDYHINGGPGVTPLLHKYEGQGKEQPAYLEINPEEYSVEYSYNSELGSGVPAAVWNSLVIRVSGLNPYLTRAGIEDFHADAQDLIKRICAGWCERWNGNNHVGELDADALDALFDLGALAERCGCDADAYNTDMSSLYEEEEWEEYRDKLKDLDDVEELGLDLSDMAIAQALEDGLTPLQYIEAHTLTRA